MNYLKRGIKCAVKINGMLMHRNTCLVCKIDYRDTPGKGVVQCIECKVW